VPSQALALALAASIYPPAVAAVIALGRGSDVRPRVFAFVLAAWLVTYAMGVLILYVLVELGATGPHHLTPGAAVDVALGVLLILLAIRLRRKRSDPAAAAAKPSNGPSKIERYLESRRLAFVLGITLYVLPSPIYIGAVKAIADANLSTGNELLDIVAVVAVMLWLIELPMLMFAHRAGSRREHARKRQPVVRPPRTVVGDRCRRRGRRLPDRQGPRSADRLSYDGPSCRSNDPPTVRNRYT
jgi:MFS family permease